MHFLFLLFFIPLFSNGQEYIITSNPELLGTYEKFKVGMPEGLMPRRQEGIRSTKIILIPWQISTKREMKPGIDLLNTKKYR